MSSMNLISEVVEFEDGQHIHVEVYPSGHCFVNANAGDEVLEMNTDSLEVIDDFITLLGQARDQMRMAKGIKK